MGGKTCSILLITLLILGMVLSVSCAKKTITVSKDQSAMDAAEAARLKEMERQKAIEEENLRQEALRKQEMAIKNAKDRFINEDVLFDFDTATLKPEAQEILKVKAKWLKENPKVKVMIEGHCDERGTADYNIALGDRRANAVKAFLMDLGVASSRMNTISYGEEKPKVKGHDETAWSQNRRAHFVIL